MAKIRNTGHKAFLTEEVELKNISSTILIRELQKIIQNKDVNIYSYIVFGNDCTLKDVRLSQSNYYVIQHRELLQSVLENAMYYGRILSDEDIDNLYRILLPYTEVSPEEKKAHNRNIQEKYKI